MKKIHQRNKKRKNIMKISSIIAIAFISGAAGAIAGTLFAPGKGTKTRKNIARKGQEYKDYVQDHFNDITESIAHPFEDTEDRTIRLSKNAIKKAKKIKAEAF
jgi:gas vesicle protein